MYVIIAPLQIKDGYKEQFIKEIIEDARGSVNNEPGCLRFDVIQDASDTNRIWVYEVYKDEAASEAHAQTPHFIKFLETATQWQEPGGLQGAGEGASNIWPPDNEWK